jgi:hypothetical protein
MAFCCTLASGPARLINAGLRSAKSRREQSQQGSPYSITSSASESRLSEILMPSAFAVLTLDHPSWFLIYPSL